MSQFSPVANVNDLVTVVVNERGVKNIVQQNTVSEDFVLFTRGHLNHLRSDFNRHFRVLMQQFQGVVEHFHIFFQRERVSPRNFC